MLHARADDSKIEKAKSAIEKISNAESDEASSTPLAQQAIYRKGGNDKWVDTSMADWDPNDFRIFVGDIGNDVTEDMLKAAFSKYPSVQRVRVVRDPVTQKTRGFGFVSIKEPKDFLSAMKEMGGKYIGNRPISVQKAGWQQRMRGQPKNKKWNKKRK